MPHLGDTQTRTGANDFANHCLTTWLYHRTPKKTLKAKKFVAALALTGFLFAVAILIEDNLRYTKTRRNGLSFLFESSWIRTSVGEPTELQSVPINHSGIDPDALEFTLLVNTRLVGIEPTTLGFGNLRSTN